MLAPPTPNTRDAPPSREAAPAEAAAPRNRPALVGALASAVARAVDPELARIGRSASTCPYFVASIEYASGLSAEEIEALARRYSGVRAGSLDDLVRGVATRAQAQARAWVANQAAPVQRSGWGPTPDADPEALRGSLGPGSALDAGARSRMERAFGESFADVRVHDDAHAASLASGMRAHAFTVGEHVAFGSGKYRPGTIAGDALLAHELAHTLQQRGGGGIGRGEAAGLEHAADRAAAGAMLGGFAGPVTRGRGLQVQRCDGGLSEGAAALLLAGALTTTEVGTEVAVTTEVVTLAEATTVVGTTAEAAPIVMEAAPIVAEAAPVVAEAAPVVAEAAPVVTEASSAQSLLARAAAATGLAATTTIASDSPTGTEDDDQPSRKPFEWEPRTTVANVIASGGIDGALDFKDHVPSSDYRWHAHHVWPEFLGGDPDQRLMGIRSALHLSVIHPTLLPYMQQFHPGLTGTTTGNAAFIARLRTDPLLRDQVWEELYGYYLGIDALTDPFIPPIAWEGGLDDTLMYLGGP